jgi:hypothetical protein
MNVFDLVSHWSCSDDIGALRRELQDLGATHVVTYDKLDDKKAFKAKVIKWTDGQVLTPSLYHQNFYELTLFTERTFASA